MFDMIVTALRQRTVSTTYTMTVGKEEARLSVMIVPEADQVSPDSFLPSPWILQWWHPLDDISVVA